MTNANTNGQRTRAALYIRVSSDEQAEHGYSIPDQRRELLAYAERESWVVVDTVVDDGYSGAVGTRPGLDRITRMAEAGEIDVILAKKRNRLFRDRYIRMGYERQLQEYGVRLLALDDAGHRLADAVMDEFGDWYREEVTKNTIAGRMQKAREGKLIASHTPIFGFAYTEDRNRYVVVPEHMRVVERIIRSVAAGKTLYAVKKGLEAEGIPTPTGRALWPTRTIRDMVDDDAYRPHSYAELEPLLSKDALKRLERDKHYGIVWYPRRKVTSKDPDPERGYKRPQKVEKATREEQVAIPVVASGIPREMIDAARERVKDNRQSRSSGYRTYELSGIVRCGECGSLMTTDRKVDRKVSGDIEYFYYRCSAHHRNGLAGCTMNIGFPAEKLERGVLHKVLDAVKDRDELIRKADEDYEAKRRELTRLGSTDVAGLRRELDAMESRKARAQHAYMEGAMSLEDLQRRSAEVDAQKAHVERFLVEYESREKRRAELKEAHARTVDLIQRGEWEELGKTQPEWRNKRYREIGLRAETYADKSIRLTWGVGNEVLLGSEKVSSGADTHSAHKNSPLILFRLQYVETPESKPELTVRLSIPGCGQ